MGGSERSQPCGLGLVESEFRNDTTHTLTRLAKDPHTQNPARALHHTHTHTHTHTQAYVNLELPDVQAGFRKGRSTKYQIANICWIIEKTSLVAQMVKNLPAMQET